MRRCGRSSGQWTAKSSYSSSGPIKQTQIADMCKNSSRAFPISPSLTPFLLRRCLPGCQSIFTFLATAFHTCTNRRTEDAPDIASSELHNSAMKMRVWSARGGRSHKGGRAHDNYYTIKAPKKEVPLKRCLFWEDLHVLRSFLLSPRLLLRRSRALQQSQSQENLYNLQCNRSYARCTT